MNAGVDTTGFIFACLRYSKSARMLLSVRRSSLSSSARKAGEMRVLVSALWLQVSSRKSNVTLRFGEEQQRL